MRSKKSSRRIGIYAGTFDPVHSGHIAFALQALQAAKLDKIYFVPERRPRAKAAPAHFGHRVAMLKRALKPHAKFDVLELVDISFNVEHTLPALRQQFASAKLIFLFGSDVATSISRWPLVERLLKNSEIVIGLRNKDDKAGLDKVIKSWPIQPKQVTIIASYAPKVSSGKVRTALSRRQPTAGLLRSVQRYSDSNWLYISLSRLTRGTGIRRSR